MRKASPAMYIIWYEVIGFLSIIALFWFNEFRGSSGVLGLHHALCPRQDAVLETVGTIIVGSLVVFFSVKLLSRLHHLEEFLRVCAWCHKVGHGDEWVSMDEFVTKHLKIKTTHGICPNCYQRVKKEL